MTGVLFLSHLLLFFVIFVNAAPQPRVFTVVEHAVTDTVRHFLPGQDSIGDVLGFANPIFDATNSTIIGSDSGHCIRTIPGALWDCMWTLFLADGQLTVEGPFRDSGVDTQLAITGGAGVFASAQGSMTLHYRNPAGTEFDFIYRVLLPNTIDLESDEASGKVFGGIRVSEIDSNAVIELLKYVVLMASLTVCAVTWCAFESKRRRQRNN